MRHPFRKDNMDAILDAADDVKAARGGSKAQQARAKAAAKQAVAKDKADERTDRQASQRKAAVERNRESRRKG